MKVTPLLPAPLPKGLRCEFLNRPMQFRVLDGVKVIALTAVDMCICASLFSYKSEPRHFVLDGRFPKNREVLTAARDLARVSDSIDAFLSELLTIGFKELKE